MMAGTLALAAVAAGCNAFSSVMQRKANRGKEARRPFGPSLVAHVIAQPGWLLGFLAMIASFLLQATALNLGTLSAVEPVLVLELPLTLLLATRLLHHRMHRSDGISCSAMAVGLALFVAVLAPTSGTTKVSGVLPGLATAATVGGIAILALVAWFGPDRSRAALFGVAAGSGFGLTASLIKISVSRLSEDGVAALFTAWETYGFVLCGAGSVILVQAALHAGTLVAAQPGITLLDPMVAVLWGTLILHEATRTGAILGAGLGCALVVAAVLLLARSSALIDEHHREPDRAHSQVGAAAGR